MVDRVEYHVEQATVAVQKGRVEMKLAQTYQSKARKVGVDPSSSIYITFSLPIFKQCHLSQLCTITSFTS